MRQGLPPPPPSIQFGDLDELRERAQGRLDLLVEAGVDGAQLYGHDPNSGVVGTGAFFLLLDEPQVYGLSPDLVVPDPRPTRDVATRGRRGSRAICRNGRVVPHGGGGDGDRGGPFGGGRRRRVGRGEQAMVPDAASRPTTGVRS